MAIYQRGDNWYIDFTFKGQRIRESIGPSKKSAKKIIAKKKTEIAENKYLDIREEPEPITFHKFGKEYLQWAKANKKPSSWDREISTMRRLDKEFGSKVLQEITTWQIEKWKAKRKEAVKRPDAVINSFKKEDKDGREKEIWYVEFASPRGKKGRRIFETKEKAEGYFKKIQTPVRPATVNRELSLLKHIFSKAIEWGKCKENPARKVKKLKGEVKRVRFLMPDEVQTLISNCPDYLKPIVTVAVHTGMRKGELLGLQWDRVNFEQGIITLQDTKNGERRDIPMNETTKNILKGMERNGDNVFCNEKGDTFVRLQRSFEVALNKSGIEDFRFHDLRHTFASNLVMGGEDLNTVRELLGHKDLTMTLRYSHLSPNHKTRAINVLDRIMSQNPPQIEKASKVVSLRP
jgi:integrase